MDSTIIISWTITLLILVGLIVFIELRSKNKGKRTLSVLQTFAKENNSSISIYDTWNKTFIGLDKDSQKLFFIRSTPDREIRQVINVLEITDCKMLKTARKVSSDKETLNVIDRIEVVLSLNDRKPDIALEFYNCDYNWLTLTGELELAIKWVEIIKSMIANNNEVKAGRGKKLSTPLINQAKTERPKHTHRSKDKTKNPFEEAHTV